MSSKSTDPDAAAGVADALRRIVRALRLSKGDAERETGLSSAQLYVLRSLAASPATSLGELARRTLTDPSSVSVVVGRLVARRLVARSRDPDDRRRLAFTATDAGLAIARSAPATAHERLLSALRTMSRTGLGSMRRRLDELVAAMGAAGEPARLFFEPDPVAPPTRARVRRRR